MQNPDSIRLALFLSVLIICALWEWVVPRKALTQSKRVRWLNNIGLVGLNSLLLPLLLPILAIEAAYRSQTAQFGVFNWVELPVWFEIVLAIILLDFAIYLQHLLFHRVPLLWRLHRMHHSDQDIDVTTGARFHPIEIILSMLIKVTVVYTLGISPIAVLLFEIVLNASAMFNHSNARLPRQLDKSLRRAIVTPDMHRVHHSIITKETHSNFGFFLSIWDRWFGTYIAQPEAGHDKVEIGIPLFRKGEEQRLDKMLTQPFRDN